jgi:hypothetical protein
MKWLSKKRQERESRIKKANYDALWINRKDGFVYFDSVRFTFIPEYFGDLTIWLIFIRETFILTKNDFGEYSKSLVQKEIVSLRSLSKVHKTMKCLFYSVIEKIKNTIWHISYFFKRKHTCKFCGARTILDDADCWINPNST